MKRIEAENLKAKPGDYGNIGFGKLFTDYMFVANYNVHTGWDEGCIQPFANLSLHPAATALHYAQEIFEGMKAFRGVDGNVRLFRVEDNFNRFNASADAIAMPEIPRELFVDGIETLVALEKDWLI
ncbi:MAG: branched-chain amino acid aminotransferase, partial [Erysipelotrichaceae bacterium]